MPMAPAKIQKTESSNELKGGTLRVGANPFGNPFVNNDSSVTTSEGSIPKQNPGTGKRVLQNRYVQYK